MKSYALIFAALLLLLGGQTAFLQRRQPVQPLTIQSGQEQQKPFAVRIYFSYAGADQDRWTGTVSAENARIAAMDGWKLLAQDHLSLNTLDIRATGAQEKGITLRGSAGMAGRISIVTNRGSLAFNLSDLALGKPMDALSGKIRIERLLDAVKLTDDYRDDDFPSIAVADDNSAWAVWQSYKGRFDEIRLSRFDGEWRTFTRVPGISGDVWRPQVALDGQNRLWIVWSQQVDGNFDIYARALEIGSKTWQPLVRLSSHPNPDIDHHLIADSRGGIWVVWQGFHGDNSNIFLRHFDGSDWSEEVRVTDTPANDWEPRIAVDAHGKAYIVWDSYRNGNYDVYLRTYDNGILGPEVAVASTPKFEAHASVAVDRAGRVWVAWDESGPNWAKDTGTTTDLKWQGKGGGEITNPVLGVRIYQTRNLNLVVLDGNQRKVTAQDLKALLTREGGDTNDFPQLLIDPKTDRVALMFHRRGRAPGPGPQQALAQNQSGPAPAGQFQATTGQRNRSRQTPAQASSGGGIAPAAELQGLAPRQAGQVYWETAVTFYDGESWTPLLAMPESWGRCSMRPSAAFGPEGSLWAIWPTDGRAFPLTHNPVVGNVYAARIPLQDPVKSAVLKTAPEPEKLAYTPVHPHESADVAAIRNYRSFVDGVETRVVRGDFHRHTELSRDGGGRMDGSLPDFYRYMIDVAAMDFGGVTDHNAGGDYEYWWWLTQKTCDMYHISRAYTTFYAYERSVRFPDGHRNVIHTTRNVPVVSFFTEPTLRGPRPPVASSNMITNDTKLLYESLRRTGGISIPHTSISESMGTDWRDNDPKVEPVVEIFQGCRVSNETRGGPRAPKGPEDKPPGGYQEAGWVWNAYRKGYRLGTITSSDHNSTHISYAMVYTEQPTREAIFDAIKKRHTYGATDNIILDYRMGDHFMGDEFTTSKVPPLKLRVIGTGPVATLEIIKDEKVLYTAHQNKKDVTLSYIDQDVKSGTSYYYVRVIQEDGQVAWSSPIWVNYRP